MTASDAASGRPFTSPAPSQALRVPALRGRRSHRGSIVAGDVPTRLHYESKLEHDIAVTLLARPDVAAYREQAKRYETAAGAHVFDGLVTFRDGRKYLVAVKPHEKAQRQDMRGFLTALAAHIPAGDADGIIMLSRRNARPSGVQDAELIRSARHDPPGRLDDAVMAAMAASVGAVRIDELARTTDDPGGAFRAIVRRIADGDLVVASPRPITPASLVRRA